MKIKSIHFFRGIAILFIIAGHFLAQNAKILKISIDETDFYNKFLYNFINGGTGMFVFISGFLFYSVFYKRFEYVNFIKKKFQNVYIPYLLLSSITIVNVFFIEKTYKTYGFNNNHIDILKSLYTGIHMTAYWYITFIMIVFLLSPLFIKYIESKHKEKILIISFFISMIIQRPIMNLNQMHSVLYFTFFYLLGIWTAMNKERILKYLNNKIGILSIITVLIIIIETYISKTQGNYHKNFFEYNGLDLMLIQKALMCLILFKTLDKFENSKLFLLDKLAEYSFVIYFLHPFFMKVYEYKLVPLIGIRNYYLLVVLEIALTVIGCSFIAIIVKKIFGKYSRYFIGY